MPEPLTTSPSKDPVVAISNHEAHLRALHSLSACLAAWNEGYSRHVNDAIDAEMDGDPLIDLVCPAFADTCFADVAQSLAFITTTAAFVESFFKQSLPAIGADFTGDYRREQVRFLRYGGSASFWDPTKPTTKGDKIATMIREILEGSDLMRLMVPNFPSVIDAIFTYRNQMIHNGFEWSLAERRKFARAIVDQNWHGWFFVSETDDREPWFFTVTPRFRGECLELCTRSVHAVNGLIRGG